MKRSTCIIGLAATALVIPMTGLNASAVEIPDGTTEWTEWISDDGGSAGRELPSMSANGRYVVLAGRSQATAGIWIKDRAQPALPSWRIAAGFLFNPDISADGRFVAWAQYGSGETGGQAIYVYQWRNPDAVPQLASVSDAGVAATGPTDYPSLSGNGRYVAFETDDATLDDDVVVGQPGGGPTKVYVRDRTTGDTEMVSVTDANAIVNGNAIRPDITPDGRFVAFASDASVLQGGGEEEAEESFQQVYIRDREEGVTLPVSLASDGTFGDGGSAVVYGPTISDDGARVGFDSDATNLVAGDTNLDTDAFVREMSIGETLRVSVDANGDQVDLPNPVIEPEAPTIAAPPEEPGDTADLTPNVGAGPAISGDGQFVAFESLAALTPDDLNQIEDTCEEGGELVTVYMSDVYRYGLVDLQLTRWSKANDIDGAFEATGFRTDGHTGACVPANNGADATISADGSRIAFVSAGNLTGRAVEEEEGEAVVPALVGTSIEPNVYLHRPHPEPDIVPPESVAMSTRYVNTATITVRYRASDAIFPWTGVDRVQLWGKKPGDTEFTRLQVDIGAETDNLFTVSSKNDGLYRFYTVAKDVWGNWEAAPNGSDTVTEKDSALPTISNEKVVPNPFDISRDRRALLSMRISEKAMTTFLVKQNGVVIKRFDTELSTRGIVQQYWNGLNDAGRVVRSGHYVVVMKAKDLAGNLRVDLIGLDVTR